MSEEANAESTATEASEAQETPKPTETVDFWKSKAREQEKRAKANAEAAAKLAEFEESQKTETQRLTDQLAAEKAQRETVEKQALRYRVAAVSGVPADLIDRLQGDTEEELTADAAKLLELVAPQSASVPKASPRQGAAPAPALNADDPLLRDLKSKLGIS